VDIAAAIELGKYISVDAADALSAFMVNRMPDPARFLKLFGDLIVTVAEAAKGEHGVAVFGESVQLLWAQGNAEAAIRVEKLANRIAKTDVRRGYSVRVFSRWLSRRARQPQHSTDLCRALSRSVRVKVLGDLVGGLHCSYPAASAESLLEVAGTRAWMVVPRLGRDSIARVPF
jgi:hypothetical protein